MADPIRFEPLNDDSEEDCQCARCGSSVEWIFCGECCGNGYLDEDRWEYDEDEVPCSACRTTGGAYECLSSAEYCKANPIPGRENIPRGKIEWFTLPARSPSPDTRDNG